MSVCVAEFWLWDPLSNAMFHVSHLVNVGEVVGSISLKRLFVLTWTLCRAILLNDTMNPAGKAKLENNGEHEEGAAEHVEDEEKDETDEALEISQVEEVGYIFDHLVLALGTR